MTQVHRLPEGKLSDSGNKWKSMESVETRLREKVAELACRITESRCQGSPSVSPEATFERVFDSVLKKLVADDE